MNNTINYTEFEPKNLTFTKLEENERTNGQLIGYPRYKKNGTEISLEIQLPWIKLFTYGVPQLNQFYKTDADRAHVRVPLDLNDDAVVEFVNKIKEIDSIMSSPEMMETLLGKKSKKYKYQSLYREAAVQEEDSDEETDKKKKPSAPRPPYFKLKLKLSYPDKKIESKVFESEEIKETGKKIRTKVDIASVDDFANKVRYQSVVRCIMKPFKIWAHPLSKKDPEFGISCRLERIEVDKASITGSYQSVFESENFIDSDDELPKISDLKAPNTDNSDDSDSDEKVTKQSKEKIVEINSDDSSDDEQDVKPSKQTDQSSKQTVQSSKQKDDSDSDDDKPVSKQVLQTQDSDSSDEEVVVTKPAPKKKAVKKTK